MHVQVSKRLTFKNKMVLKELLLLFLSYKNLARYIRIESGRFDFLLYIIMIIQISFLPSIPSGFHSPNLDGWIGFSITVSFTLLFYSVFYFWFYSRDKINYIREIVIISVIARLHSFVYLACIAIVQTGIWAHFKLPKPENISLIYFILYYFLFALIMIFVKRSAMVFREQ